MTLVIARTHETPPHTDVVAPPRDEIRRAVCADVTVVVPVHDRPDDLDRCLAGLTGLQLIVVDDASADGPAHQRVAGRRGARYLRRDRNGGPGAARNSGLAVVSTPLVAFVDSDCLPSPGWLEPLLRELDDPHVAAVAPRILAPETDTDQLADSRCQLASGPTRRGALWQYEQHRCLLDMGEQAATVHPAARVAHVPTAALVARTDVLGDGFDETLRLGEDVDLLWRLCAAGHEVRYQPAAVMRHRARVDLANWVARRVAYGSSVAALDVRHPGVNPCMRVSAWGLLAVVALWTAPLPVAVTVTAGTVAAEAACRAAASGGGTQAWIRELPGAVRAHLEAAHDVALSVQQVWWPMAVPAAFAVRRLRWGVVGAMGLPQLVDWARTRPDVDPVRYVGIVLGGELCGSAGFWAGVIRHRRLGPLAVRFR